MTVAQDLKAAIKSGLATLFDGLADFNGTTRADWRTEVHYGYPFGIAPAEFIYFRATSATSTSVIRTGRNVRNETGELEIVVVCMVPGGGADEADERAHDHREQIETWIADRKTNEVGVTGLQTLITNGWTATPFGNDNGHGTELAITVRWTARLT